MRKSLPSLLLAALSGFFAFLPCTLPASEGEGHTVPKETSQPPIDEAALELAALLQARYETTMDITVRFLQETRPAGTVEGLEAEGQVFFKRPHLMRWEYRLPEPQLIVTSGDEVFVYEEKERQVMVLPREQFLSSEISRAFFFGEGELERSFAIRSPASNWPEAEWTIVLEPLRPQPQVRKLWVTLDPKSHLVREIWIEDQLGGKSHLLFKDIRVNQGLADDLFRFTPPAGVQIYRSDVP